MDVGVTDDAFLVAENEDMVVDVCGVRRHKLGVNATKNKITFEKSENMCLGGVCQLCGSETLTV